MNPNIVVQASQLSNEGGGKSTNLRNMLPLTSNIFYNNLSQFGIEQGEQKE